MSELPRVGTRRGMIKAYRKKTLNCAPIVPEQAEPRRVTETRDRGLQDREGSDTTDGRRRHTWEHQYGCGEHRNGDA